MKNFAETAEVSEWSSDDWETPDNVAKAMANLVEEGDRWVLEPAAGTGQICKAINMDTCDRCGIAVEVNPVRWRSLESRCPDWQVYCFDFLGEHGLFPLHPGFDVVIANPPFSKCLEFIERSLSLLNPDNPNARLLFLLPVDWACSLGRAKHWRSLDAHIHQIYLLEGRQDYLKNGVPASQTQKIHKKTGKPVFSLDGKPVMMSGRQVSDAVFDIRLGRGGRVNYLAI